MLHKLLIIAFLSFAFAQFQSCNKEKQGDIREIFNINSKVELLFFYKKNVSEEERDYFYENILMRKTERGHWTRDGVQAAFGVDKNGYTGFGITFTSDATKQQREDIMKRLKDSSIVYKVYENTVPDEIKDLPEEKKEPIIPDIQPTREPKTVVTNNNS